MPAKTLSQAIDLLVNAAGVFERPAGPVLTPLLDAVDIVGEARRRLDGLEEDRATLDVRSKAFERALELAARIEDPTGQDAERVLEVARFLAPGWAELERADVMANGQADPVRTIVTDPLLDGRETREELEASQAAAESASDAMRDLLTESDAARQAAEARIVELEDLDKRRREYATAFVDTLTAELARIQKAIAPDADPAATPTDAVEYIEGLKGERDRYQHAARILNPLFGGPHINDELEDLDTHVVTDVSFDEDDPGIVHLRGGQAYTLEDALVIAARIVETAQDRGPTEGLFAAIYRKVTRP